MEQIFVQQHPTPTRTPFTANYLLHPNATWSSMVQHGNDARRALIKQIKHRDLLPTENTLMP